MGIVLDYEAPKPKQRPSWGFDIVLGGAVLLGIAFNFCATFDVIALMKGYSPQEACRDLNVFACCGLGWVLVIPAVLVAKLAGFNAHWISVVGVVPIAVGGFIANSHFVGLIAASC